jgi:hypothetical protein
MSDGWVFEAAEISGDYDYDDGSDLTAGDSFAKTGQKNAQGMTRGLNSMISNAKMLGIMSEDLLGPIEMLFGAMQVTAGAFQMYKAVNSAMAAARSIQEAMAAAEAANAALNPAMWPNLALAGVAAASVYSAFQFTSGEWEFPAPDLSSPSQREGVVRSIQGVNNG